MRRIGLLLASLPLTSCTGPRESGILEQGILGTLDIASVNGTDRFTATVGLREDGSRPYNVSLFYVQPSGDEPGCVENDMLQLFDLPVAPQGADLTDEHRFGAPGYGFSQQGGTLAVPEITDTRVVMVVTGGTICDWHEDYSQDNCRPNPEPITMTLEADRLWTTEPPFDVRPSTTVFDPVTGEPFCEPGRYR
jgi:hypothetical protein